MYHSEKEPSIISTVEKKELLMSCSCKLYFHWEISLTATITLPENQATGLLERNSAVTIIILKRWHCSEFTYFSCYFAREAAMAFITMQSVLGTSVAICVLATTVAGVTCSKKKSLRKEWSTGYLGFFTEEKKCVWCSATVAVSN